MRYSLKRMLSVGAFFNRYEGTLEDGIDAEICLLRVPPRSKSISDADNDLLARWMRRFKFVMLAADATCRPVIKACDQDAVPFIALPLCDGPSLAELVHERRLTIPDIESMGREILQAIMACERIGLRVGGVTLDSVHRSVAGNWQVDISGLCSPVFGAIARFGTNACFVPPELEQDVSPLENCDSAAEVYSVGAVIRHVLTISNLHEQPSGSRLMNATVDCVALEPSDRPTVGELLNRLINRNAIHATASAEPEWSSDEYEPTMNAEEPIEVPVGIIVIGCRLGRYEICEKLGTGGMGSVYRAEDKVDGGFVAVKTLNKQVTQESITARRFAKEARIHAKANSPYVANLLEVNADAVPPYLVVEYVEGGTLGDLVRARKPLDQIFALTVITDAVRGLAVAHARGVVHRDFKPDNVLLTRETREWMATHDPFMPSVDSSSPVIGRVYAKVADFGLARAAQQSESLAMTREGSLLGTPMYMSPEQCRGEAAEFTSDVYSVGVTLFQLLAGRPPFESESQAGLLNLHCSTPPPSLKQLRPELSDALVRTIENCLAKNSNARYANAGNLLIDLENILRGEPTSLGLHPPVLGKNDPGVMHFEHSWNLASEPNQLWPYISNTDRVNHAIGLPSVTYTTRQDPVLGTQRFAETKVAGMRIRWQEHPYEWIEGRRFSVLREFTHGPFHWFVNVVELIPTAGGGTQVVQSLSVAPRNWLGKQVARLQLGRKSKAGFGRAYQQIDSFITQSAYARADRDPFAARTELRPTQRQKLHARLEQLRTRNIDPLVIDTLGQFLEHASDLEVARIRPLAIAERFRLNADQVVNACLEGTRIGLFNLLWDIMCPSCRIPADIQETLSAIKDHGYCEACNLKYTVDLADSVELIFRIHSEIRDVTTGTYCIGGPAWSRHVVAQLRLAAGERFACELRLSDGAYIVRGPQLPFTVDLRVGHNIGLGRIELALSRPPSELRKQLSVGSQVIHFCNDSNVDQQIRIERTAASHDALSAAKASTLALFRELFPTEILSADQMVSVAHITLLRIKLHGTEQLYESSGDGPTFSRIRRELDQIMRSVKENSGAVVKTVGEGVFASFANPVDAVRVAMAIVIGDTNHESGSDQEFSLEASAAVHVGTAMVATVDDRLDYFGKSTQILEKMIADSDPLDIYLSSAVAESPDVQQLLAEEKLSAKVVRNLCDASFICQRIASK